MTERATALPVTEYTPASRLRRPRQLWREMWRDLRASRELAARLLWRNLRARYRQSVLGWLWVLLAPAGAALLFLFLRRAGVFGGADPGVPYPLFLLCGFVLWQAFADALQAPLRAVSQSRTLLARVNFPREALILAGVGEGLAALVPRLVMLALVGVAFGHGPSLQWLPGLAALAVLVLAGAALGLALVPVGVLYQDVEQLLALALPFWMLLSPVLYLPPATGPGAWLMGANPVAPLLDTARACLLGLPAEHLAPFAVVALASVLVLVLAWIAYRLALPILIERMGP